MSELSLSRRPLGPPPRGITQSDVSHAADSLLRSGERPTIEKIRAKIGRGSPNTINPMLDAWWKTLSARLDSGPAALHRLPESIAHIAEALWMQALDEGRRRALLEQRDSARLAELDKQRFELRSHVLTLREGEFDSRLRDRNRTIEELNLRLRELTGALRKEQATRESLLQRLTTPAPQILARRRPSLGQTKTRTPRGKKGKKAAGRAGPLRKSIRRLKKAKRSPARKRT
jgi:Plasmid replication region DNA-binding N-term